MFKIPRPVQLFIDLFIEHQGLSVYSKARFFGNKIHENTRKVLVLKLESDYPIFTARIFSINNPRLEKIIVSSANKSLIRARM